MRWFGADWGAPVCADAEHVDTPVDHPCLYCERLIDEGDVGFELPVAIGYTSLGTRDVSVAFVHRDCLLRAILPLGFKESLEREPPV